MVLVTTSPGLPLWSDHLRFLKHHRALLEAAVGVGLLVGLTAALLQPATWSATASVSLTPVPVYVKTDAQELVAPEVSIDTDAQLLGSPEVLGAIARQLDVPVSRAADHLSVTASPLTHVLHVSVTGPSAASSQAATAAAVDAFVVLRGDVLGSLQDDQLQQVRLALVERENELADITRRRLVLDDEDLVQEIIDLRTGLAELEEARAEPAAVITPAAVPRGVDYPNREVPVVSGAALGLLAGLLLALLRDRLSHRAPPPPTRSSDHQSVASHQDHHHAH